MMLSHTAARSREWMAGKDGISSVIMHGRHLQSAHISASVGNVILTLIAVRLRPSPSLALLRSQLSKACLEFSLGSEFSLIECRHIILPPLTRPSPKEAHTVLKLRLTQPLRGFPPLCPHPSERLQVGAVEQHHFDSLGLYRRSADSASFN